MTLTKFTNILHGFLTDSRGVVSIEVAVIAPLVLAIGLLSYDAGGLHKSISRSNNGLYAIGDTISSVSEDQSCYMLGNITGAVLDAYRTGHWAMREDAGWWARWRLGERDFQFRVQGLKVQDASDPLVDPNNLKAEVIWSYHKRLESVNALPSSIPGTLVEIPKVYQISDEFYIRVEGINRARAPIGFMNIFGTYMIEATNYFVPRYIPEIHLAGGWRGPNCAG